MSRRPGRRQPHRHRLMFSYLLYRCWSVVGSGCCAPAFFQVYPSPLPHANPCICRITRSTHVSCTLARLPLYSHLFMSFTLKIKAGLFSSPVVFLCSVQIIFCFLPTIFLSLSLSVHLSKFGTDRGFSFGTSAFIYSMSEC